MGIVQVYKVGTLRKNNQGKREEVNLIFLSVHIIWGLNITFSQELPGNQSKKRKKQTKTCRTPEFSSSEKKKSIFFSSGGHIFPQWPQIQKERKCFKPEILELRYSVEHYSKFQSKFRRQSVIRLFLRLIFNQVSGSGIK